MIGGRYDPTQSYAHKFEPFPAQPCDSGYATFEIQTIDTEGNPYPRGEESFSFALKDSQGKAISELAEFITQDNGDGTYSVAYTSSLIGRFDLIITSGGFFLSGNPYSLVFVPGRRCINHFLIPQ